VSRICKKTFYLQFCMGTPEGHQMILGDDTQYLHLGGNRIEFYRKVKNLGLLMNDKLTGDDQVSKVCRNVLFTLKRLWTMWHFTPLRTRHKLVTSHHEQHNKDRVPTLSIHGASIWSITSLVQYHYTCV
jgi:hypothetical protein